MAEVVVVPGHQMDGMVAANQNVGDEVIPGGGHHLVVERNHDDLPDAEEAANQIPPVLGRIDQRAGLSGDDFLGRTVKGKDRRGCTPGLGLLHSPPQQGGMAQMDSVKEAQGNHFFLDGHNVTLQRNS